LESLTGLEHARGECFRSNSAYSDDSGRLVEIKPLSRWSSTRPEVDVNVQRVPLAREVVVVAKADGSASLRAVDRIAIGLQPGPNFTEHANRFFWDGAVGRGSDIEQVIAALLRARGEVIDDLASTLPFNVVLLISPAEVHGFAGLPSASVGLDLVLGGREVAGEAIAVVHDDFRLESEDHLVHLLGTPLLGVEWPVDVVPENVNFAVVGHELTDEAVGVVDEALAGFGIGSAASAIGMMPIHKRVVEADAETLGASGLDEFADEVSLRPLPGSAVVGELGVPETEALMMLGGEDHVLLPCPLGKSRPLTRDTRTRPEMLRKDFILRNGNALGFHDPLLVADDAVEAPVDEHTELGLTPPGNASRSRADRFCRFGTVRLRGLRRSGLLCGCRSRGGNEKTAGPKAEHEVSAREWVEWHIGKAPGNRFDARHVNRGAESDSIATRLELLLLTRFDASVGNESAMGSVVRSARRTG